MATSIELENIGRERYQVKDVKAKVQVDRISKELKVINEFFDREFSTRSLERKNYGSAELENLLYFKLSMWYKSPFLVLNFLTKQLFCDF